MRYYQFNIGDYRSSTTHLSNEEDLAYRRLIDMYYDTEKPIPLETQAVSRRLRLGLDVVESVLKEFFLTCSDGHHHARCDHELALYHQLQERARTNGKLGGRPRRTQPVPTETQPEPRPNPALTKSQPNHKPITNNQYIQTSFAQFWAAYPRHVAKQAAIKAWQKANPQNGLLEQILNAIQTQRRSPDWTKDNGQFIPHPATWLNQRRWEDEDVITTKLRLQVAL